MTVSDQEAIHAAASAASAAVKRGLGERGSLDVLTEEVHLLMVLQLARSSEIDEGLTVVYKLFDVLDDAGCLQLPREEACRSARRIATHGGRGAAPQVQQRVDERVAQRLERAPRHRILQPERYAAAYDSARSAKV